MKKLLKIFLYTLLCIIVILIIGVAGLNIYYNKLFSSKTTVIQDAVTSATMDPRKHMEPQLKPGIPALSMLPYPQKITSKNGIFKMPGSPTYKASPEIREDITRFLKRLFNADARFVELSPVLDFIQDEGLHKEGYTLDISTSGIEISYNNLPGLYYALVTLKHLNQEYNSSIPCMKIEDYPDMEIRGVMLDISRNKIPTIETLFQIVDHLSDLKINHFQLYVEGFSFGYPSFRELWEDTETPVTPEEIRELDKYCRERFIDLVPNQNSLGHMMAWLETDQYKGLAECPGGYKLTPFIKMKGTLDPYDPRCLKLVGQMMEDMFPNFSSGYFNANLDEPFELGLCKSRKEAKEKGAGQVYIEYVAKVNELTKQYNRKMMMWGDVLSRYPEIIPEIPEDITVLEWGYEAGHPFDEKCRNLSDAGLEFLVCPGTSSWTTLTGRTDNMFGNIYNAVTNGQKYGAKGILLTDWGDMGHWQYMPVSYPGYAMGAALSWNAGSKDHISLENYLNTYVFQDDNGKMGSFVLDLGRYNQFEEFPMPNMTLAFLVYQTGLVDVVIYDAVIASTVDFIAELGSEIFGKKQMENTIVRYKYRRSFQYSKMMTWLDLLEKELDNASMNISNAELVRDEFRNAIRMIRLSAKAKNYMILKHTLSIDEKTDLLLEMKELCSTVISENKKLWLSRNRNGGLDLSMQPMIKLQEQIDDQIALLKKGPLARKANRLIERTVAAGFALYVK